MVSFISSPVGGQLGGRWEGWAPEPEDPAMLYHFAGRSKDDIGMDVEG